MGNNLAHVFSMQSHPIVQGRFAVVRSLLAGVLLLAVCSLGHAQDRVDCTAMYTVDESGATGRLDVTATIEEGYHIFPTHVDGFSLPTTIKILTPGVQLSGEFVPDTEPHTYFDVAANENLTVFEHQVTWSVPLTFDAGFNPRQSPVKVKIDGQVCENNGSCARFGAQLTATLIGKPVLADVFRPEFSHAVFSGNVSPAAVRPGDRVKLSLLVELDAGWVLRPFAATRDVDLTATPLPALFFLSKTNGWESDPAKSIPVEGHPNQFRWEIEVTVPKDANDDAFKLNGMVAVQTYQDLPGSNVIDKPATFKYSAEIHIAHENSGTAPLVFLPGPTYEQIVNIRRQFLSSPAVPGAKALQFSGYNPTVVMALAFLAGLILNVMPCVLPVIGLKVMSFVQQAGEHHFRVFLLNYLFAAGMLSVFVLLATLAVFSHVGWARSSITPDSN